MHASIDEGVPADVLTRPCTRGSRRAAKPTSPTRSSPRCAKSSAGTTRNSIRQSARRSRKGHGYQPGALRRVRVLRDVGDLAHKKIFPALYSMVKHGTLDIPVIGVASSKWTLQDLQDRTRESITTYGGGVDDEAAFDKLTALLKYVDGNYTDPATFKALKKEIGDAKYPCHYLAIPPSLFETVVEGLDRRDARRTPG